MNKFKMSHAVLCVLSFSAAMQAGDLGKPGPGPYRYPTRQGEPSVPVATPINNGQNQNLLPIKRYHDKSLAIAPEVAEKMDEDIRQNFSGKAETISALNTKDILGGSAII